MAGFGARFILRAARTQNCAKTGLIRYAEIRYTFFSFLGVTGLILAARLVPLALLFAPIFWAYHYRVIRSEEKALASIFGSAYARYREDIPRLWPRFSRFHSRTSLTVDPRKITRAISEVAWFLIALGCLEIVEHMRWASEGSASLPVVFTWPF